MDRITRKAEVRSELFVAMEMEMETGIVDHAFFSLYTLFLCVSGTWVVDRWRLGDFFYYFTVGGAYVWRYVCFILLRFEVFIIVL